jgi:trimethylamine--corrinoid protein Co-methyltransferase
MSDHTGRAFPRIQILSRAQIEQIHEATLHVLERVGVKVYEQEALELLRSAGCRIDDKKTVKIPGHLVHEAIESAPKTISIADRNGQKCIQLGGDNVYFGPAGVSAPYIRDSWTGERRPLVKADIENAAKIVDALPNIAFIMVNGVISDVSEKVADLHEFEAMLRNTTKPIVLISQNRQNLAVALEIAKEISGSLESFQKAPFFISHPEPSSPLFHTREAIEKLLFSAEKGIPQVYPSAIMSGASAPATLAGTLVITNAETLSGLVIAQLKKKGAPFIIGGIISIMDMSTGILSYGAPEKDLMQAGFVDMARHYRLPVWGTGGNSDSKIVDQQAAIESTFSCLMSALSGANMVHDPGYIESGLTTSHEMLVMTDEIVGMVNRVMRGITIDEEHIALDLIERVGPQGNFLSEDHTFKHFRKEHWHSTLFDRQVYASWRNNGEKDLGARLKERVKQILNTHEPMTLPEDIREKIVLRIKRTEEKAHSG